MIVNVNSIVQHVIQIKNGIIKHVNVNVKIIVSAKKNYSWNPSTCICEISKYLKSIADNSVTESDEIVIVMDTVSTTTTTKNTVATNVTSTASINCHSKKVRDNYILHTVLLETILSIILSYY